MPHGIMTYLRQMRRLPALIVLMSFLLPLLVAALPSSADAAERAFLAEIARSYCNNNMALLPADGATNADQQNPADQTPQQSPAPLSNGCCILCLPSNAATPASDAVVLDIKPEPISDSAQFASNQQENLPSAATYRVMAPRGPPALI